MFKEDKMEKIRNKNHGYKCDKCKVVAKVVFSTEDHIYCDKCVASQTRIPQEEIDKMEFEE